MSRSRSDLRTLATALGISLVAGAAPAAHAQQDTRVHALHTAAADGDTAKVRALLAAGVDPNAPLDVSRRTALIAAAEWGQTESIRLLLAAGARAELTDRDGRTARTWAERMGHAPGARLLRAAEGLPPLEEPRVIKDAPAAPAGAAVPPAPPARPAAPVAAPAAPPVARPSPTAPGTPAPGATPRDGLWRGTIAGITTGGGQTVSFRVTGGRVVETDFFLDHHCAPGYASRERMRWGFRQPIPVVAGAFARLEKVPNTDLEVAGRFPSTTTAEGTFMEEDTSGCTTRRARWTARWVQR